MDIARLGEQIGKFRRAAGLTQEDLGRAVGVSTQAVSRWENGGAPDIALLPALADRLGVTIDALFGRGDGPRADMGQTTAEWLGSLPRGERLDRLCRIIFKSLQTVSFSDNLVDISYLKSSEPEMPKGGRAIMPSQCLLDEGLLLGIFAEDFSFAAVLPEPSDGYAAHFAENDDYRRFFSVLARPGALELLETMAGLKNTYYTPGAMAKRMGLPIETVEKDCDILAQAHLLAKLEVENDNGSGSVYIIHKDPFLVPFLYLARILADPFVWYGLNWGDRKKPILRDTPQPH